ncbi:MAG: response regulator [Myxococcales bacterium]|nr:response regulator [Myxococcales bacterium]MCB9579436.1 response regulator [Polyangiaceae bacterium]
MGKRVLLVDDDPVILELGRAALEGAAFEVATQSNALGMLATLLRHDPDIVVMDVSMPSLRGDHAVGVVRRGERRARFVVLYSGMVVEELRAAALRAGANGYISKSVTINYLGVALRRLVEGGKRMGHGALMGSCEEADDET